MTQPITLYGHHSGPNPWKIAIVLSELGIPYETKNIEFPDMKKPEYEAVNPNGRVPAITDPNTGLTIFESGAIIEYLVETYDKDAKLHYTTPAEAWKTKSWLFLQVSGQGPYLGQLAWFSRFHQEKVPSAIERYTNETKRLMGVFDRHLKKEGSPYLVGDKCTYADLSFVPWHSMILHSDLGIDVAKEYPDFHAWNQRVASRPATQKILGEWQKSMGR